ncbi:MAG: hypothetical protein ACRC6U_10640 [Fusobacteriaceae bacterium]
MSIDLLFKNVILDSMISLCIFEKMKRRKEVKLGELLFYHSLVSNKIYPDRTLDKTYSKIQENIKDTILLLSNKKYITIINKDNYKLLSNSFKISNFGIEVSKKLKNDYYYHIKENIEMVLKEYPVINSKILRKVVYNEDK